MTSKLKKVVACVAAAAMTMTSLPQIAFADTAPVEIGQTENTPAQPEEPVIQHAQINAAGDSGTTNDGLQYSELTDGTLSITGYTGSATSVTIPDDIGGKKVTQIGDSAFSDHTSLKTVKFSDNITFIGSYAFWNCTALTDVVLPKNLLTLGQYAFSNCTSIKEITIPKSLTTVETDYYNNGAPFADCDNLKTVKFENGTTTVVNNLFQSCTGLENIVIPDTVTYIGRYAFEECTSLKTVTFSDNITEIGSSAFNGCTALTNVVLPKNLLTLGQYVFSGCTSLAEVTIPKSLTTVETNYYNNSSPFANCDNLKTVKFAEGTTSVVNNLFQGCTGLEEITIPDTVTYIGSSAFSGCTSLKTVKLSDNITEIGRSAFENCTVLNNVVLPKNIITLNSSAFYGCSALTGITLPEGLKALDSSAFSNCTSLKEIEIPKSAAPYLSEYSCDYLFSGCTSLTTVKLPDELTIIGMWWFKDCTSLSEIKFPTALTTIYSQAFSGCTALKQVVLPDKTSYIDYNAFENCTGLTKVYIPQSVTTIGEAAFKGCSALTDLSIDESSIKVIGNETFMECTSLKSVVFPRTLTEIKKDAFKNDINLTEITLYPHVTSIDTTAFSYPAKMTVKGWKGSYAETFANDKSMTFVPMDVISFDELNVNISDKLQYTGEAVIPEISIYDDIYPLVEGIDYEVNCANNVELGKASVTITLNGPMYEGSKTFEFEIVPADITNAEFSDYYLSGTYNDKVLKEGVDYTVDDEYIYDIVLNSVSYCIHGIGNFTGELNVVLDADETSYLYHYQSELPKESFEDAVTRWTADFSIADESVWSKVDKIVAAARVDYGYTNGCIGYTDINGDWHSADFEQYYGKTMIVADNIGGIKSMSIDDKEVGLELQLWYMDNYSAFYLQYITLYDKDGNVLIDITPFKNTVTLKEDNNSLTITDASITTETSIMVPSYTPFFGAVTSIADGAFAGNSILSEVIILPYVNSIGVDAFKGCSKDLTFIGYLDTATEQYAIDNNINFKPRLDGTFTNGIQYEYYDTIISDDRINVSPLVEDPERTFNSFTITFYDYKGKVDPYANYSGLYYLIPLDLISNLGESDTYHVYVTNFAGFLEEIDARTAYGYLIFSYDSATTFYISVDELKPEPNEIVLDPSNPGTIGITDDMICVPIYLPITDEEWENPIDPESINGATKLTVRFYATGVTDPFTAYLRIFNEYGSEYIAPDYEYNSNITQVPVTVTEDGVYELVLEFDTPFIADENICFILMTDIPTTAEELENMSLDIKLLAEGEEPEPDPDVLIGDVNGDGEVGELDSVMLARYLANWDVTIDKDAADLDGDGEVGETDSVILARRLAGWNV